MKRCANCGRESMDQSKFCQFCGTEFEAEEPPQNVGSNLEDQSISLPDYNTNEPVEDYSTEYREPPQNKGLVWLILSSVLTFFGCCCLPLGFLQIAAIVTSAVSVSRYKNRDYPGSEQMAKVSMIIFFSVLGLSVLLAIIFAATGVYSNVFENSSQYYSEFY